MARHWRTPSDEQMCTTAPAIDERLDVARLRRPIPDLANPFLWAWPGSRAGSPRGGSRSLSMGVRLAAASAVSVLSLAVPAVAFAHGDEGEVPARESVLQAIAYVVNTPSDMDMITDKLTDAKESADQEGVDVAEVDQAMQALEKGDMPRVRLLLEESIGARADLTGLDVRHVLQVAPGGSTVSLATGEQPGTLIVTDELSGRGSWTGTDSALIGIAAAAAAGGMLLGWRFRPTHSIHQLRRLARPVAGEQKVGG